MPKRLGVLITYFLLLLSITIGLHTVISGNLTLSADKSMQTRGMLFNKRTISPVEEKEISDRRTCDWIVIGAREEVKRGTVYDASYISMEYPGGDVPEDRGACTDVIVRGFRKACIDLQKLIHEDMRQNFVEYPQLWGLTEPDANIDHRRVPNQMCFFRRHGISLPIAVSEGALNQWQWGDVVYWRFPGGMEHCGIVSDMTGASGLPLVIHNAGVAREEDCLIRWEIIGHFRYSLD